MIDDALYNFHCNFRTGALSKIRSSKSLQNLEAITSSVTSNLKVDFQSFR